MLVVEEELLARRKDEISAAVYALQYAILEFHGRLPNRELGHGSREHANPVPCLCLLKQGARAASKRAALNCLPNDPGKT